ncbi:hypothetical protein C7378_1718 [Acidipila rosea]|uniref:Uncharacterized protein n=1 Tax=Acidipila rosea TaxID=768535 RepID=A0A4R1L792_9BACT|nr:hypothetical protein C7378_1718 [Acidipila rosea]
MDEDCRRNDKSIEGHVGGKHGILLPRLEYLAKLFPEAAD